MLKKKESGGYKNTGQNSRHQMILGKGLDFEGSLKEFHHSINQCLTKQLWN